MIYFILFFEFFKIGLFAIGGGMVTIPFLFDLSRKFDWFTAEELTNMIAVSQSTPGPIGVNMSTYAGFMAAGALGGIVATVGLVLPSVIIIVLVSKILDKYVENVLVCNVLAAIRPAVIALIMYASYELFLLSATNYMSILFVIVFGGVIRFYKKSPIFYIVLAALLGCVFKL